MLGQRSGSQLCSHTHGIRRIQTNPSIQHKLKDRLHNYQCSTLILLLRTHQVAAQEMKNLHICYKESPGALSRKGTAAVVVRLYTDLEHTQLDPRSLRKYPL